MLTWYRSLSRTCFLTGLCALLTACGGSASAPTTETTSTVEPLYWLPSTVPAIAQIDVTRLRKSPYFGRIVEMWKGTPYYDPKLEALVEAATIVYVGMRDIDPTPDSEFFVVARGSFDASSAIAAVDAMLHSGVLGNAARTVGLQPDTEGGWSADYGRVMDDGKNTAHLEELSPGVWALSVSLGPGIRASSTPAPPSAKHFALMDEVSFSMHTVSFVADTADLPGDFASTTLVLDADDSAMASSRQRTKTGISPEAHAQRLNDQLSQFSMAATLAGFGSLKEMVTIRAEGDVLAIDAQVPPDVLNKALEMAQSLIVPR